MINIQILPTRIGRIVTIRERLDSVQHGSNVEAVDDRSLEFTLTNDQAQGLVDALRYLGPTALDFEGVWDRVGALIVDARRF